MDKLANIQPNNGALQILGAPFNEVIFTLRGWVNSFIYYSGLKIAFNFFDNTLDNIVHSTLFLDGWIGIDMLEFVVFDWDRLLRPKGVDRTGPDRFFCKKEEELKVYLGIFEKLGYKN